MQDKRQWDSYLATKISKRHVHAEYRKGDASFPQWDSIPATTNIYEWYIYFADATTCFFFHFSTDKKLSATKKPVVMKVALNTKKAIQSIMVYFRRVLHRFMVWQTRTCWTDFKLTESNVLQHIHFTLFLDNDWYICRWTWISYIKYKYFINAL